MSMCDFLLLLCVWSSFCVVLAFGIVKNTGKTDGQTNNNWPRDSKTKKREKKFVFYGGGKRKLETLFQPPLCLSLSHTHKALSAIILRVYKRKDRLTLAGFIISPKRPFDDLFWRLAFFFFPVLFWRISNCLTTVYIQKTHPKVLLFFYLRLWNVSLLSARPLFPSLLLLHTNKSGPSHDPKLLLNR